MLFRSIGLITPTSPDTQVDRLRALREGLKENGFVEGENVSIAHRWTENQIDRLPELIADLMQRKVAVIATAGDQTALAAKATTTTIPIVFVAGEDPVSMGLVASIARPGGNMTGVNIFVNEVVAKRLELLRELVPGVARVAVFFFSSRRRHTRCGRDWSSDVCSSDLPRPVTKPLWQPRRQRPRSRSFSSPVRTRSAWD